MKRPAGRLSLSVVIGFAAILAGAPAARAQAPTMGAIERWVDGLLAEARSAGATRAERGPVTVDKVGGFVVGRLAIDWPNGGRLSAERIVGEGISLGPRFNARGLRAEGVAFAHGTWRIEAGRIALDGLGLPARGPAELFGRGATGLAATVRELSLTRASVPALSVQAAQGPMQARIEVRDIAIAEVARGIARSAAHAGATVTLRDAGQGAALVTAELGPTAAERIDLTLEAEAYAPPADAARDRRIAYGRVLTESVRIETAAGRARVGAVELVNVRARAPRMSYGEMWRLTSAVDAPAGGRPTPEQLRAFIAMLGDVLEVVEIERLSISPTQIEAPGATVRFSSIDVESLAAARFSSLALTDLAVEVGGSPNSLASLVLRDVDYARALIGLMEIGFELQGGVTPGAERLEGILPRIGAIELRTAALDVPTPDGQRQLSLGGLDFALGRWRGLVPDRVRLAVSDLRVPAALLQGAGDLLPPPGDGRRWFGFGAEVEMRVDAAVRTASLRPARLLMPQIGAVDVELTFGDVDPGQLGAAGLANPAQLLDQATFRELRVRVENTGLVQRLSAAGRLPNNDLRSLAPLAQQLVASFVQDRTQAERARAALEAFARDPRALTVVVTPRGRLGAGELLAALRSGAPPTQILSRVDLSVSAGD